MASSVFYAFHDITLLALLAFSISINATTSFRVNYQATEYRRLYATLGVIANLVILLFFKYSPLFARSFFEFDQPIVDYLISIPLPLGISFYTFQGISLMIDVFKDPQRLESPIVAPTFREHLTRTYLYIAFFPQLIAGPIVKAQEFMPQIRTKLFSKIDWEFCFRNLVIGYFLKMVVADNLKEFTFWIEYPYFLSYKPLDLFFLLVGYSCQIFADFAGYSSIAIGLAGLFGYKLHINFNFPYAASSFKDFWKRWHISLSSFLMEYLYFPLGGSHKGRVRTYLNLFIVMALGGLWHGAAWSYLVWGFMHGIFLSTERFFFQTLRIDHGRYSSLAYSGFVFLVVTFAWLLFRLPFAHVLLYLQTMFSKTSLAFDSHLFLHILAYSSPILIYHVYGTWGKGRRSQVYWRKFEYGLFALLLFLIFFNSGTAGTFIYFQF
ncbi:alginate O-acetyltransferase complex protein AlgI [Rhabdobacter roseus]|uniref:Alginate O-acetyltransferase complex protein AlgI n=1 Tax=Rhabdobacter roseus TaxID=1655419 RepID=A0A840TTA4_9BACT|nr:alginate O-acetyltransferase complex protein AlgI [Rhabdobacter roseus]